MNKIGIILVAAFLSATAIDITYTIPDDVAPRVVEALCGMDPVPVDTNGVKLYTDNQWARQCVRRLVIRQVNKYEDRKARKEARENQTDTLFQLK